MRLRVHHDPFRSFEAADGEAFPVGGRCRVAMGEASLGTLPLFSEKQIGWGELVFLDV